MLRVKGCRIDKGLTQREVAEQIGIHKSTLSQIESGRVVPRPAELNALAAVLGCPPDRLLDHIDAGYLGPGAEARADAKE